MEAVSRGQSLFLGARLVLGVEVEFGCACMWCLGGGSGFCRLYGLWIGLSGWNQSFGRSVAAGG